MPAGNTFEAIATQTLGSAAATVTFSSIPGTYTDLVLIFDGTITTSGANMALRFNSDTGTNYSRTVINGNGSSATSFRSTNNDQLFVGSTDSGRTLNRINIMNYSNSTTNKTCITRSDVASGTFPQTQANACLWRNTAAITSIEVRTDASTFTAGSTFSLYGIKAA